MKEIDKEKVKGRESVKDREKERVGDKGEAGREKVGAYMYNFRNRKPTRSVIVSNLSYILNINSEIN